MGIQTQTFRMRQTSAPPPYNEWRNHTNIRYGSELVYKSAVVKTRRKPNGFRPMTNHSAGVARDEFLYPVVGSCEYDMGDGLRIEVADPASLNLRNLVPNLGVGESSSLTPTQANLLKIAARAKVKDQKINIAMTLHGAKSTVEAIVGRLNKLHRFVRDVKSGNLTRALSKMRDYHRSETASVMSKYRNLNHKAGKPLAKMWLEVNFVHMQVYSDVKGLYDEFQKQVGLPFLHGRAALVEQSGPLDIDSGDLGLYGSAAAVGGALMVKKLHYVQLSYSVESETLKRASSLGLTNVPFLLWDATPMSYIVDWVWPMGQYFQAMDATLGLHFEGGCIGSVKSASGTLQQVATRYWHPAGPAKPISGSLLCAISYKEYSRSVLLDDSVSLPGLKNPLSGVAWKVATIAALLSSAVSKPQTKPWR